MEPGGIRGNGLCQSQALLGASREEGRGSDDSAGVIPPELQERIDRLMESTGGAYESDRLRELRCANEARMRALSESVRKLSISRSDGKLRKCVQFLAGICLLSVGTYVFVTMPHEQKQRLVRALIFNVLSEFVWKIQYIPSNRK